MNRAVTPLSKFLEMFASSRLPKLWLRCCLCRARLEWEACLFLNSCPTNETKIDCGASSTNRFRHQMLPIASICVCEMRADLLFWFSPLSVVLQNHSRTLSGRIKGRGEGFARARLLFTFCLFFLLCKGLETGTACRQEVRFAISGSRT